MKRQIIFYAPIGKGTPIERIGGAEAGCLKTMDIYTKAGIDVLHLNRPVSKGGIIKYAIEMCIAPIRLFFILLLHPFAVVHIVGFYHRTVLQEYIMMSIGHILNHKVIYELRNGSMVKSYNEGSAFYRKVLGKLLKKSDVVLCQGMEYIDMIRDKFGIERSYYPNYIMNDFIEPNCPERGEKIRLVYVGRVVPEKNIDVCIKVLGLLRNNGKDAYLDIVGGYNEAYKNILNMLISEEKLNDYITFHGRKQSLYIKNILHKAHYFLFPSAEVNEGHSNALTEAMGCGVVPIASAAGFNASICGVPDLIAKDILPESYFRIIQNIEKDNRWAEYSDYCYNRILNNYTESIVSKKLIDYITPLFAK